MAACAEAIRASSRWLLQIRVDASRAREQTERMKAAMSRGRSSGAKGLDRAINKMLRGLKRDIETRYGSVDYDKLRREGYSSVLLGRLKNM